MAEKKVLFVQIDSAAICIETVLQQILKPYPAGIYIKGNEHPSITPDDYFFRTERLGRNRIKEIEVKTIDDIQGNIFNEDGEIVITDRVTFNKQKFLSTQPTVAAYGRAVVRAGIKDFLDYLQVFKNHVTPGHAYIEQVYNDIVNPNFHNNKSYLQYEDIVKEHMEDHIYSSLREFVGVGKRGWDILLVTFDRDSAKIEDGGDYRIHRYMEEHGHEHTNKSKD